MDAALNQVLHIMIMSSNLQFLTLWDVPNFKEDSKVTKWQKKNLLWQAHWISTICHCPAEQVGNNHRFPACFYSCNIILQSVKVILLCWVWIWFFLLICKVAWLGSSFLKILELKFLRWQESQGKFNGPFLLNFEGLYLRTSFLSHSKHQDGAVW